MLGKDQHTALKSEAIKKISSGSLEVVLARLQWSKDDIGYSLHVNPSAFSSAGLQTTDFLKYLGFQRNDRCNFTNFHRCYSRWVDADFDIERFVSAFNDGYEHIGRAQTALSTCGFLLPQPEGWGFFNGRSSGRSFQGPDPGSTDGHTGVDIKSMKATEDDRFEFRFTFLDTGREKAFVTHYRPKHLPVSSEVDSVFKYLGLRQFHQCAEFEFEACYYRTLRFSARDDGFRGGNVDFAHQAFDAHSIHFSLGVESLLAANAAVESAEMSFLPIVQPAERMRTEIATKVVRPTRPAATKLAPRDRAPTTLPDSFDVAISFAGTERDYAQQLAQMLRDAGYAVFYDDFYPEQLWGKNLTTFFDEIYRKRAKYCVMFVSKEYQTRKWTSHEARSAQARALEEKGNEYILPIRVDDTELEGLLPTIGYVPISTGMVTIAEILLKKLGS